MVNTLIVQSPSLDKVAPLIGNQRSVRLKGMTHLQMTWSHFPDQLKHSFIVAHWQNERFASVPHDRYGIPDRRKCQNLLEDCLCVLERKPFLGRSIREITIATIYVAEWRRLDDQQTGFAILHNDTACLPREQAHKGF